MYMYTSLMISTYIQCKAQLFGHTIIYSSRIKIIKTLDQNQAQKRPDGDGKGGGVIYMQYTSLMILSTDCMCTRFCIVKDTTF